MTSKKIQLAACWYKLARAVAIADEQSVEIEEKTALHYLIGFLRDSIGIQETELFTAKEHSKDMGLDDAIERVSKVDPIERERFLTGLILVARADNRIDKREQQLIASIVNKWQITLPTLEKLSLRAKGIDDAINGSRVSS